MKLRTVISLLILLNSTIVHALSDSFEWDWRAAHVVPLRWDNIEDSSRQWIAGVQPEYDHSRKLHVVELGVEEHTQIAVPAGQWLRILSLDGDLRSTDLTTKRSIDGRLFIPETVRPGRDPHSLVSADLHAEMGWVRIEPSADRVQPLRLALFVSREPAIGDVVTYPYELDIDKGAKAVRLSERPGRQTYWYLRTNQDAVVEVEGPQRIKLHTRLKMDASIRSPDDTYHVMARLDEGEEQILELETGDERRKAIQVDACTVPLGRIQHAYIDIPPGKHRLRLRTNRELYVQLMGSRGDGNYLFHANAAEPPLTGPENITKPSIWSVFSSSLQRLFSSSAGIPESERLAQRLARDNHWQPANLMAAQGLAGQPGYSVEAMSRFKLAKRRAGTLQHYVDLLPNSVPGLFRQRTIRFSRLRLVDRKEPQLIWQQQVPALAKDIASGEFIRTPVDSGQALQFRLPDRGHDSLLRLVVSAAPIIDKAIMYIQFDDEPAQTILLDNRRPSGRSTLFQPDRATLAAVLAAKTEKNDDFPGSLLPWGEMQVPARVRRIRLWAGENELWSALQLQEPVSYPTREGAYLAAVDAAGREKAAARFINMLRESATNDLDYATRSKTATEAELENHWLPLVRYLHAQARYFSVTAEENSVEDKSESVDPALAEHYQQRADKAEKMGDWVLAIEYWSHALHQLQGESRQWVQWRRALALRAAGEVVLASRELWRLYRDGSSHALQIDALSELLKADNYETGAERGVRIMSAALLVRPDLDLLERLLPVLVATGRFNEALQIALLLPEKPVVTKVLLEAARGESWWTVFERARKSLPDGDEKRFWSAWPAVAAGDYSGALKIWAAAGEPGKVASERLQEALEIRKAFSEPREDERQWALLNWENWQLESLEKSVWRSATETVRGYAGSATVVIPQLGINLRRYLATPSQGVELAVYGPTRLRVKLRPLYPRGQVLPEDDWLMVSIDGRRKHFAVNGNAPDPERYVAENDGLLVGQREQFIIDVPRGYHQLQLLLRDREALFGIDTAEPAAFNEVLPVLTPENAVSLLTGRMPSGYWPKTGIEWPVQLAEACEIKIIEVSIPALNVAKDPDVNSFARLSELREPSEFNGRTNPVQELTTLLWQAEQDPSRLADIATRARTIYTAQPASAETQAIMRRIQRNMTWKPVTNLWQRAGVRDITLNKAGPEHPSARIRHALLPVLDDVEERVSGWSALVFSLEQPHPTDFDFDFTLEGLLEKPTAEIRVAIKVDNQKERILRLGPQYDHANYRKTIESGTHSVRLRLLDPVARHSVRIRVRERQPDNNWALRALRPAERSYDVATVEEPLIQYVHGPGLLRIDEWRGDHISSRYRIIDRGWQKLSFDVPPGQKETLYRVFQWVAGTPAPGLPVRLPESLLPELPSAPVTNEYTRVQAPVLQNQLRLGGQEDGTLSGTLEFADRRNLDEDRDTGAGAERFIELRASHRRYLPDWQGYHRFDALTRLREDGGPTLGLREFLSIPTGWRDVELDLNGSVFIQRPGGEADTEWLGDLRARVLQRRDLTARSYHRPSLRLFRRWMSLNDDLSEEPERVDQDIFTTYKKQHRQGLGLGDDLFYRPRGDMVSWLGINVTSNDDFNIVDPDHLRGRIGTRLLWRDWDFGAEYAATHYFEDDDRNSSRTRERLRLEAQLWRWNTPRNGLQMRFRFDHDRSSSDNSLWLSLTWHRANGRLFRDFRPGDLNLRGLRERISNERLFRKSSGGSS